MSKQHRTVSRVAAILETVAGHPEGVTFSQLVQALRAPKSSVHSLVQGLLDVGYLAQADGAIILGSGLELIVAPLRTSDIRRIAHPKMVELSRRTTETVVLSVRSGTNSLHIDQVESTHLIKYATQIPQRRPLEMSSAGKVFLANLDDQALHRYVQARKGTSPETDRALERVVREVPEIRRTGIAYNRGETVPGVFAIGAPLKNSEGIVVAALSIAGPQDRMETQIELLAARLAETTQQISSVLGAS